MTWTGVRTIMVLELRQRVRATRWRIMLGIWLAVLIVLCGGLVIAIETTSSTGPSNDYLLTLYDIVVCFVLGIGLIVAPTLSATSINGDRADATLALLQATALRSHEIVVGKLLAACHRERSFMNADNGTFKNKQNLFCHQTVLLPQSQPTHFCPKYT